MKEIEYLKDEFNAGKNRGYEDRQKAIKAVKSFFSISTEAQMRMFAVISLLFTFASTSRQTDIITVMMIMVSNLSAVMISLVYIKSERNKKEKST